MIFGWRRIYLQYPGGPLYTWAPWAEQLEMFPQSGLTSPGTDGRVVDESSVSAPTEMETLIASVMALP